MIVLEKELEKFKTDFINRCIGKSPTTLDLYAGDIKTLATKPMYESPEELAKDLVEGVNRKKQDDKYEPSTKNRFVASTRAFLKYLEKERKIDESTLNSFLLSLVREKVQEKTPLTLTFSQFEKIMGIIPSDTYTGTRDRAIFYLMYHSGLRESEVLNLKQSNLKENGENLSVEVQGKYKRRTLTLNAETTKEMRNYLRHKKQRYEQKYAKIPLFALSLEPLFADKKRNKALCTRQPRRKFTEWAEKAGVKAELHYLRNSYIKSLVDSEKSAEEIEELTGIVKERAKTLVKLFSEN